ncbi:MAG: asparagine synthase (glutamine-hydrolyzing) [Bacteroidota bacterium]|nr:asparagine synthase (glutamine-hydrolyzing) [Bacteroidota bacterium]
MCGIAGILSLNPNEVTQIRLKKMTDCIAHRGPDGEGQWISEDSKVGFGHRRLSIIDLSEHARQPMHYMNRYTITYNGEIYNYIELRDRLLKEGYSFETSSDTEVLMALYDRDKEKCLKSLDGMFAFAIYDAKEKTVFCARDRFGEKPFHYYYEKGKCFIFGSEMKEIWAAGIERKIYDPMLFNYLHYGLLGNPENQAETFFENIKRLEQSHFIMLRLDNFKMQIHRYWDINLAGKNKLISLEAASEKFRELFFTSVKRRLRSDVPVGSSLSGGLDSSLVVCVIDELNQNNSIRQKTFSAQFPGYEKNEAHFQQIVIDKTKSDAYFSYPDSDVMMNEIDKVFYHQEEPFGSASIIAQYEVFKLAKQHNVTVLLDGQGADEYLAGYHPYFEYFFMELKKNKREYKHQWDAYTTLHQNSPFNPVFRKGFKYYLRSKFHPVIFNFFKSVNKSITQNTEGLSDSFFRANKSNLYHIDVNFHKLDLMLKRSMLGGGLQELLRYADRNSMAHSREVRLPFLNHELVEFVFTLPANYIINEGWTKYIMRKAFAHLLPSQICWRTDKLGYEPPQKKWMESGVMKEIIHENRKFLVGKGILDKSILSKEIKGVTAHEKGDNSWGILMAGKLLSNQ